MLFPARIAAGGQGALDGVDVRARDDGWAVGGACPGRCRPVYTLIEHWNGRRWSRVPSPNVSRTQVLTSVSAVSARDAWAVGAYFTRNDEVIRTLIEHWNGRRWSRVPSPNPSASPSNGFNLLASVTAVSGRDVWAAGNVAQGRSRPLIPTGTGSAGRRCRARAGPAQPDRLHLRRIRPGHLGGRDLSAPSSLAMRSSSAGTGPAGGSLPPRPATGPGSAGGRNRDLGPQRVGGRLGLPGPLRAGQPAVANRDPALEWPPVGASRQPEPRAASALTGFSASSATNAWAVGEYCTKACPSPQAENRGQILFLHWNGARWSRVAGPSRAVTCTAARGQHAVPPQCLRRRRDLHQGLQ